ncbi:hypothetical protein [Pseudomonas sp. JG-B]|uniref:hypothetical protein n=1 Tax=Pseudomonas sp. JG-B TaxID=2603214 RepID=UPI00129DC296|nr:hypothetical protein [Pseudomonas sp. JG-B]MRK19106.1 hypothetical protein [Pseudomonas sp. JG-B]
MTTRKSCREIETAIIRKAATVLLDAGYEIRVHDGCESGAQRRTVADVLGDCFSTDVSSFYLYRKEEGKSVSSETALGWVQFIHGNGCDVMADHTLNLEAVLQPVSDLADRYL